MTTYAENIAIVDIDARLGKYTRDYLMKPHWKLDDTFEILADRIYNLGENVWSEIDQHIRPLSQLAPMSIKICDYPHDLKYHVAQWTSLRMLDFSNQLYAGRRGPLLANIPPTLTFLNLLIDSEKDAQLVVDIISHQTNLEILRLDMFDVKCDMSPMFQNLTNLQTLHIRTNYLNILPSLPLLETFVWELDEDREMALPALLNLDWSTHFPSLKRFGMKEVYFGEWAYQLASILPTQLTSLHLGFPAALESDRFVAKLKQMTQLTDLDLSGMFWDEVSTEDQLSCVPFWPLMRLNPFEHGPIDLTEILPEVAIPLMSQCGHIQHQCWFTNPQWTPGEVERLCQSLTNLTSLQFFILMEGEADFIVSAIRCLSTQLVSIIIGLIYPADTVELVRPLYPVYQLAFPVLERFQVPLVGEHIPACVEFLHRHTTLRHLTLNMQMCFVSGDWDFRKLDLESLVLLGSAHLGYSLKLPPSLRSLKGPQDLEDRVDFRKPLLRLEEFNNDEMELLQRNRIRNATLEALAVYEPTYVRDVRTATFR